MNNVAPRFAGLSKVLTAFVVLALLAAVFLLFTNGGREKTMVADFKVANSLYKGNEVRMMGVPIGKVTKIEPLGDRVRITLQYDGDVKLPADAKAVVVSPSVVGDRFIQLGPAYTGGATLPDNARLGIDRTAVPVELDDIFKSIDNLALSLGPTGANKDGALSRLVNSTAEQFDGQGAQFAATLKNFAKLSRTLDNNDEELFASVRELDEFNALLRRNDKSVRKFFDSTADVSEVLADERDDLADTIKALREALTEVRDFVRDNRSAIRGNVDNLESLAALLADRSDEIDHLLAEAPTSLANLGLAGVGLGVAARANLGELLNNLNPITVICAQLGQADPGGGQLCPALQAIVDLIPPEILDNLLGLGSGTTAAAASSPTTAGGADQSSPTLVPGLDSVIDNLSGMLAVN
ncbi:MAG TPA: MCE family protein [Aeromicrobium sp.]|nr:MCE family protein [Aeromicrobium sp.]